MMVIAAVWALAFAGFTLLAADMKHKKELGSAAFDARQLLGCRVLGVLLLLLSFVPCLMRWSYPSTAIAAWISLLGFSAVTLGVVFTYVPRAVAYLKFGVGVVGVLSALLLPAVKAAVDDEDKKVARQVEAD